MTPYMERGPGLEVGDRTTSRRIDLRTVAGILIVVVSVFSAVVTWRAAEASGVASDRDRQARQDLLLKRQKLDLHEADAAHDAELYASYAGHVRRAEDLEHRAALIRLGDPQGARELDLEAQEQRAVARVLRPLFIGLPVTPKGRLAYSREDTLSFTKAVDPELRELHPGQLRLSAERARTKWVHLVAVDTGLIAAIFLLTLSQLIRSRREGLRSPSAGLAFAGTLLAVTSTVLFMVVGW
jgi:hypothetical protein